MTLAAAGKIDLNIALWLSAVTEAVYAAVLQERGVLAGRGGLEIVVKSRSVVGVSSADRVGMTAAKPTENE